MKNMEKFLLGSGIAILMVAVYLVFFHIEEDVAPGAVLVAKVDEVIGDAKKKEFESVGWKILQDGDLIYRNDRVFTLDESFMRLVFVDGTVLNLTPNTLLVMVQEGEKIDLDLQKGFMGLELKDIKNQVTVKLGEKKVGIASGDAKIHLAMDKENDSKEPHFSMTVVAGVANLDFNSQMQVVKKGERVEVNKDTSKLQVETYGIAPIRPEGEHIYIKDGKKTIELAWESKDEMESYKITAARDPQFKKIIKDETTKGKSASLEIKDEGHYFWKVKGMKNSKEAGEAPISTFQASRDVAPFLLFPPENGVVALERNVLKKNVILRWKKGRNSNFQVEFFRYGADKDKGELLETGEDYVEVADLGPQEYKWRVRGVDPRRPDSPWSDYRLFSVVEAVYENQPGSDGPKRQREYFDEAAGEWKTR